MVRYPSRCLGSVKVLGYYSFVSDFIRRLGPANLATWFPRICVDNWSKERGITRDDVPFH